MMYNMKFEGGGETVKVGAKVGLVEGLAVK